MTMGDGGTEIERLIEQGLSLYGEGDLDGALLLWERALVIDPGNAQASSYVDYVRMNYELLSSDRGTEDSGPYAIGGDEPEYQIEILPGETSEPAAAPPHRVGAGDEGWMIDDEVRGTRQTIEDLEIQLLVDDPSRAGEPSSFEHAGTGEGLSFEDATREYQGGARRAPSLPVAPAASSEFVPEATPGFDSPADAQTPQGWSEPTDVRRRDLGFVQPTATPRERPAAAVAPAAPGLPGLPAVPPRPEREIPVRPSSSASAPAAGLPRTSTLTGAVAERAPSRPASPAPLGAEPRAALEIELPPGGAAPTLGSLELEAADASHALELVGRAETRPIVPGDAGDPSDLIASLPIPLPTSATTRPLTGAVRPPASDPMPSDDRPTRDLEPAAVPAMGLGTAPTQELPYSLRLDSLRPSIAAVQDAPPSSAPTRELAEQSERTTLKMGALAQPAPPATPSGREALIAAPTRELGLRRAQRPSTEDETTGEVDVQKVRAARAASRPIVPGIDPIEARSAEILEQIERAAPAGEAREDRTRRRITSLIELATEWTHASERERAVLAVDLALSEDPNSALAQKLIHRNREAIMNAFQSFLGDLERTPTLARPLHELGSAPISPRAAFLLSRIDGTLSLDEILDVSGMPRIEAFRYLCQLLLRGILR